MREVLRLARYIHLREPHEYDLTITAEGYCSMSSLYGHDHWHLAVIASPRWNFFIASPRRRVHIASSRGVRVLVPWYYCAVVLLTLRRVRLVLVLVFVAVVVMLRFDVELGHIDAVSGRILQRRQAMFARGWLGGLTGEAAVGTSRPPS